MNKHNLSWFVYRQDPNSGTIEWWNIFEHNKFRQNVINNMRRFSKQDDKSEFLLQVKFDLMYYFWSKSEYELVLKNWVGKNDEVKIDVWNQVMLNFDKFIDYLWSMKT